MTRSGSLVLRHEPLKSFCYYYYHELYMNYGCVTIMVHQHGCAYMMMVNTCEWMFLDTIGRSNLLLLATTTTPVHIRKQYVEA